MVSLDGYVTQTKTINCTSATKSTTITLAVDEELLAAAKAEEERLAAEQAEIDRLAAEKAEALNSKKYTAVWQIRRNGVNVSAGEEVDSEAFAEDIDRLLEIGAVKEL